MMGIAMVMGAVHHCLPLVLTWGLERILGY